MQYQRVYKYSNNITSSSCLPAAGASITPPLYNLNIVERLNQNVLLLSLINYSRYTKARE